MMYFRANFLAFRSVNLDEWVDAVVQTRGQRGGRESTPQSGGRGALRPTSTYLRHSPTASALPSVAVKDRREGGDLSSAPISWQNFSK